MVLPNSYPFFWLGPVAVLSSTILSVGSGVFFSGNIGETSCKWKLAYSPHSRVFSIWTIIYISTFASAAAQLSSRLSVDFVVLSPITNALWALSWLFCAAWTPIFSLESPTALLVAALVLTAAACAATAALAHERVWLLQTESRMVSVLTTIPLSLLAGWVIVAAALGLGIAAKALNPSIQPLACDSPLRRVGEELNAFRERRRTFFRQISETTPARVSAVPVLLSVVVAVLSAALPDAILTLPLAWAVVNLRAFPSVAYIFSLFVLSAGAALAFVRSSY